MKAEDIKNLRIAIIGAGYGGAAAAKALSLLGADVKVYEQAPQMGEVGAGIGLRPATMARFRQWGIFDAVANVSSPSDYFEILTATGDPIMKDTWPESGDEKQTYLIHRRDFIEALLGVLPEGMVQLGHKLQGIEEKDGRSVLTFTNGVTADADLVVGADGIKSTVREQLFSDKGPVFSGEHAYRVVISADDAHGMVVDDNLRMYMGRGTKVYLLPLRHRNQMSFDITGHHQGTAPADRGRLRRAHRCDRLRPGHGCREHPRGLRHRSRGHLAHRQRRPHGGCRPLDAAPPGPGRELRH
jgi:salicylate hydroxylase